MESSIKSGSNKGEKLAEVVFLLITSISIVSVALIAWFIFAQGMPAMFKVGLGKVLGGTDWSPTVSQPKFGLLPMIVGSIYVTLGSVIIGVPIGLLTAIFMAFYCPKKIYKIMKAGINLLAGIPSVVFGLWALKNIVPIVKNVFGGFGPSLLTAMILLGIMILPTIIGLSEASLRQVPNNYYEGAIALGATHERAVFNVVVPAANSGIFAAVIMGLGRSMGEAMAVKMVVGNQAVMPKSILEGGRTLTTNIVTEMAYASGLHSDMLIATGVVLFAFIMIINMGFSYFRSRMEKE